MIIVTESSLRPPQATLLLQGAQLRQQSGGFAETAGSVDSEAAAGAQVGRRSHLRAADPDPQLRRLLMRARPTQRVTWLRKAARPNVLLPAQPD